MTLAVQSEVTVLVVGAGAVGQVFARHLQLGGANVVFYVREKYRESTGQGFDLYPLNRRSRKPQRLEGASVVSSAAEVRQRGFDQVYLTVSSTGIRGSWLRELVSALPEATVVSLQPTPEDRDVVLAAGVPEDRLVSGMLSLVAYGAPLPGETRFAKPGTAYWFPPLSPSRFSGPPARAKEVTDLLRRGGLPAARAADVPRTVSFFTAILMAWLAAIEAAGWSVSSLRSSGRLRLGADAAREVTAIVAHQWGRAPLMSRVATWPWLVDAALRVARAAAPFPLEAYLQSHFTKVGDQTRLILDGLIKAGAAAGVSTSAVRQLAGELGR